MWQVVLILIIFAAGGSLTGFLSRKLIASFYIESTLLFIVLYISIITILWPAMVLVISMPFGQFSFFRKYITRLGSRLFSKRKA